jgi:hypothetical protein
MNANLGMWDISKVNSLRSTFNGASKFSAADLGKWNTGEVTDLVQTFKSASSANANIAQWNVGKVTSMSSIFFSVTSFTPCNKRHIADEWASSSAFTGTTYDTVWAKEWCIGAQLSDANFKVASWDWVQNATTATDKWGAIGDWDVSGVEDMSYAFSDSRNAAGGYRGGGNGKATFFIGTGLDKWITSALNNLANTFRGATSMDVALGSWDVSKVGSLSQTFYNAGSYAGTGLGAWNVGQVTDMNNIFVGATSFTPCSKRRIAEEWLKTSDPGKVTFTATSYDTAWANEPCFNDTTFKQATWDWVNMDTATATTTWGAIGDWDVSEVTDFSYAFSTHRDETGGSEKANGNSNAASFVGVDISTWITSAATNMQGLFNVRKAVYRVRVWVVLW